MGAIRCCLQRCKNGLVECFLCWTVLHAVGDQTSSSGPAVAFIAVNHVFLLAYIFLPNKMRLPDVEKWGRRRLTGQQNND